MRLNVPVEVTVIPTDETALSELASVTVSVAV
jgi:hypothetical protein